MRIQKPLQQKPGTAGELELFIARSGMLSARLNRNGSLLHLHSSQAPEDESNHFNGLAFWGDLIVFLGTGLGYHVAPFVNDIPSGKRILIADYYPRCVEHCRKHLFDRYDGELRAISSLTNDWERIAHRSSLGARTIQIIKHPASWSAHPDFYDAIIGAITFKKMRASTADSALLFFGSFFCEEEVRRAIAAGKRQCALFHYQSHEDVVQFESALSQAIQTHRPRYVLSINMKGFDSCGIVSDLCARFGIPVIVWFVDDPHPILLSQKSHIKNHLFAFSWERAYLPWLSRQGFGNAVHLPLAADPSLFDASRRSGTAIELGFVGSSMGREFLEGIASRFLWKKELEPLIGKAAHTLLAYPSMSLPQILRDTCASLGFTLPFSDERNITWLFSYIIHFASMLRRQERVSACMPLGIETFGDPLGWKELCGENLMTHPDVDYRSALGKVYRSIAINLNITSCQMPGTVNQRVFDIPLSGGFLLTDNQPDLERLFEPDEIAVYSSKEELLDKISYYRGHKAERLKITEKARTAILNRHTYRHRLAELEKAVL
ncbi:MAG: glycosyltransferase [Chitinispirillaceae bacterium]|nr:glycosyltransferase [Chitinispirillaceae bacterium]